MTPKYKLGQKVYTVNGGEVIGFTIRRIEAYSSLNEDACKRDKETHTVFYGSSHIRKAEHYEEDICASFEELMQLWKDRLEAKKRNDPF